MTIAIGAQILGGIVLGADTKVVASDGATTTGSKLAMTSHIQDGALFVIADAAEDGRAAKMLAGDIVQAALRACNDNRDFRASIKGIMGRWHRSYGCTQVPVVEFLLAVSVPHPNSEFGLFYCQPPSTFDKAISPVAIGRGARPVDPLLETLCGEVSPKSALLKLAYLMHIAKKDEGSACGEDTEAMIITVDRSFAYITKDEMKRAEELAKECYEVLDDYRRTLLSAETSQAFEQYKDAMWKQLTDFIQKAEQCDFPSLTALKWPDIFKQ